MYAVDTKLIISAALFTLETPIKPSGIQADQHETEHTEPNKPVKHIENDLIKYTFKPNKIIIQHRDQFGTEHDLYQHATQKLHNANYNQTLETPIHFSASIKLHLDPDTPLEELKEQLEKHDDFAIETEPLSVNTTPTSEVYRVTHPDLHANPLIIFTSDTVGFCETTIENHTDTAFLQHAHTDFNNLFE